MARIDTQAAGVDFTATDADRPAFDAAALAEWLREAETWLQQTGLLPDEATRRRLLDQLADVRRRREQLLTPLVIVLVGGTGVGKSSLLNALAGGPVAEVGAIRPWTRETTVYVHRASLLALDPALTEARRAEHERADLRDKILVDTPDYDSIDPSHRRQLEAVLAAADVVLFITTAEKYHDLAGATWLQRAAAGRLCLFVLNRADEGLPAEVRRDVTDHLTTLGFASPRVYALSAKDALESGPAAGDFGELAALIERELDAKRIRAIKEGNLEQLARRLARALSDAVPGDLPRRLDDWRLAGEEAWSGLRGRLVDRFAPRLMTDRRLRRHVEYWFGTGCGGPVGAVLSLVYGLRAALSPEFPRLWELSDAPDLEIVFNESEADELAAELTATQARLRALAVEVGLPTAAETLPRPDRTAARNPAQRVDERLRAQLGRALREARSVPSPGLRLAVLALNTPACLCLVGLPGYWLYDRVGGLWGESVLVTGPYFQGGAIVLALWLGLAAWFVDGLVKRRAARFCGGLIERVGAAVDEVYRPRLTDRLTERLSELQDDHRRLAELVRRAGA